MDDDRLSALQRWVARVRLLRVGAVRQGLARPADSPQAFVAGRSSLRVLLAGSGPVVGWGVGSHDLALPGAVARAIAATTGRGVVVDVIADPSAGVRRLARRLRSAEVGRYDVVILSAAVADAVRMVEPARWGARVEALIREVRANGVPVVAWLGAHPIRSLPPFDEEFRAFLQEQAERLNRAAARACGEAGATFVPLPASPQAEGGRHRSPADYLFWARRIADTLAPALIGHEIEEEHRASEPGDRVAAIERLRLAEHKRDGRLTGLVGTAQRTLGAEIAMFTVLDDSTEWPLAAVGASLTEIPIEQSACLHTIQAPDGMVVPDAEQDERFASSALVTGPAHLRFYAGYPVEAPDGTRIGAMCVFGRTPRRPSESEGDLDVLRELALLAQRELWRWDPAAQ
ncbi:GAF domain-containing protein [Leifsonia shinshuensis]|uniref:GDSL-type esterase/lipase family protein n=1 Tax=Leifsonia shinshuensis TaxID=150026 RepID=UPI001F50985F|nr:GDSL-type esterase/lipase family protein [Leifsonia shinshuensis]MCI0156988.1 GAF domain-containing protein [Leifsonia shinshuensis]